MNDSRKRKPLTSDYSKYLFASKEAAHEAKIKMEAKYPSIKMKVNEHGSLFCHRNGSMLFEKLLEADVVALGGAPVHSVP
ncbi:MAG: hypothetical protein IKF97_03760 [Clostridia bacterium]|nr:hypothetical protein [Clostridia bacterium]